LQHKFSPLTGARVEDHCIFVVFSTNNMKVRRGDRMPKNEKAPDLVEQPLMSTGTTEAGFEKDTKKSKLVSKPKIGETIVGEMME
jgi:hypothetical protein